jgi:hypothetical protein
MKVGENISLDKLFSWLTHEPRGKNPCFCQDIELKARPMLPF